MRFVSDLIASELSRSRRAGTLPPRPWAASLSLTEGGLTCDSLELLGLAALLGQSLHLHRSGIEDALLARRTLGDWVEIARCGLERYSAELTFLTSGSTSLPKICTHTLKGLEQEIDVLEEIFPQRRRIVAAVPSHHIYGFLFTIMLAARLELPVLDIVGRSTISLEALTRPGDLIVGHPDFWRLAATSSAVFPDDVIGVTSTAPFPTGVGPVLRRKKLQRIVEIYGSSETAGVGWRDQSDVPFTLFGYWSPADDPGSLRRQSSDGTHSTVSLQDDLTWETTSSFRVGSRRDGAFQVGGINVHPGRIAEILEAHPKVAEARVRLMQPAEGTRVKAFIVPVGDVVDYEALRNELDLWSIAHLTAPERPRAFSFGAALPSNLLGKVIDWALD